MPKISIKEFQDFGTNYLDDVQGSFRGGMNLLDNESDLAPDEYRWAFNVTARNGDLEVFNGNVEIGSYIPGRKQAITSIGTVVIVLAGGKCWYALNGVDFYKVPSFQMNSVADRLYTAFVPASTVNIGRYLEDANDDNSVLTDPEFNIGGTPSALIVQDGSSQPWLITIVDGAPFARVAKNYNDWTNDGANREYVPIGCDMMYSGDILYIVSADRTKLYRSLTGRPLDFVLSVDEDGNKSATEAIGGANVSAYYPSYNLITAISPLNADAFLVSTNAPYTYIITLNREKKVWGEPTFNREGLFSTSLVNSHSIVDLIGDNAIITENGIRSFNAARQLKNESNNAIFSAKIGKAFENLLQDSDCGSINFRDYSIFGVETVRGTALAIFDNVRQKWTSFILTGSKFRQFTSLVPNENRVFGITADDKIYELFAGEPLSGIVETRAWAFNECRVEQKLSECRIIIERSTEIDDVNIRAYVNNTLAETVNKELKNLTLDNINFAFQTNPKVGYKINYIITWGGGGTLSAIEHLSEVITLNKSGARYQNS